MEPEIGFLVVLNAIIGRIGLSNRNKKPLTNR